MVEVSKSRPVQFLREVMKLGMADQFLLEIF
jgi:hypothetical protein